MKHKKNSNENSVAESKSTRISLQQILNGKVTRHWDEQDPWLQQAMQENFEGFNSGTHHAQYDVELDARGDHFVLDAHIDAEMTKQCDRCGSAFTFPLHHDFSLILIPPGRQTPVDKTRLSKSKDEKRWGTSDDLVVEEDVDTSFLTAEMVNLAPYFAEQIHLALPMTYRCKPDCAGLCPHCGADLATETCNCNENRTDSRWEALKAFKTKGS